MIEFCHQFLLWGWPHTEFRDLIKQAEEAERLGYTALGFPDRVVPTNMFDAYGTRGEFECLSAMSAIATLPLSLKLVTAVLIPGRHPLHMAYALSTIDHISSGRLIAGFGAGYYPEEMEALGVPRRQRLGREEESVEIIKALWTQPRVDFDGRYFQVHVDTHLQPVQKPRPPIWFGGWSPKAIELVARRGDGWFPGDLSIEEFRQGVQLLRERAREAGRDPATIKVALGFHGNIAKDDQTAIDEARRFGPWLNTVDKDPRTAIDDLLPRLMIGSPETLARRVKEYIEAGCSHFNLIWTDAGREIEKMRLWAQEIIAPLKSLSPGGAATE